MMDFFAMHGYGFFVWSAYAVAALAFAAELFVLRSRRRSILEEARLTRIDDAPEVAGATA